MQIQIYAKDIELTQAIKEYAENKIGGLDKFLENIIEAQIDLARTTEHHKQGEVYEASANLVVPGDKIHAAFTSENLYTAIDGLVDELQDEIKEKKGRRNTRQMAGFRKLKDMMTSFWTRKRDNNEDVSEE
ncbi:MAG: ribosome-associated translation inhibitor RaiA [Patescibacteria group bacterium]